MGLFSQKLCCACGRKIGLLDGDRRTKDGYLCISCQAKLSPFYTDWQQASCESLKEQINYRTENQKKVQAFSATNTYGTAAEKLFLDKNGCRLLVTAAKSIRDANPDVIRFEQVTGCETEVQDDKTEVMYTSGSQSVSYNPAQYRHSYTFILHIYVNTPYFTELKLKLNDTPVTVEPSFTVNTTAQGSTQQGGQRNWQPAPPPMGGPHGGHHGMGGPGWGGGPGGPGGPGFGGGPGGPPPMGGPGGQPGGQQTLQSPTVTAKEVDPTTVADYARYEKQAEEIKTIILGLQEEAARRKTPVHCSHCGATVIPDDNGCCEYCGTKLI